MQKSWVKLSRSLRSKTKSKRRTRNRRTKLGSEIITKLNTMMKLLSRRLDPLTKDTEGDEEVKEAIEASIVAEVVGAEEAVMVKTSQTIVGEEDTLRGSQKEIPPKTMVLLDPTIEVKEAALKVNL